MGILNFTILSLGLIFFIKILSDIYTGMIKQYNENGIVEHEKKVEALIVTMSMIFSILMICTTEGLSTEEVGVILVLLTPLTYFIYKEIKDVISKMKIREHKVYEITDKSKGWKVIPYGGRRVSDFSDRNELEIYRVHTLIKNVLSNNCGYIVNADDYTSINVNYDDFQIEITLEVVKGKLNKKARANLLNGRFNKEGKFYGVLKKELLPYTYMIDGSVLKLGNNTLIARVDYCDIKVNIKRSA